MFDFQKLDVYQRAKTVNLSIIELLENSKFSKTIHDQLSRASLSIMLNISEGTSRFSNKDRKNFMVIARGSAFECVAILEFLVETKKITTLVYERLFQQLEEISKMLFGLIRRLE